MRERHRYVYALNHPLVKFPATRITEQRFVYYNAHGDGLFPCHQCGALEGWEQIEIIHLNGNTHDNGLSNLAPRCSECNRRALVESRDAQLRRLTKRYQAYGQVLTLDEWSQRLSISRRRLEWRINRGWPLESVFAGCEETQRGMM